MSDGDTYELAPAEPPKPPERPHTRKQYEPRKVLRCPKCKYDLRGSSFERCPECGLPLTTGSVERAQRNIFKDVYQEPLLYIGIGLGLVSIVTLLSGGSMSDVGALLVGFGIFVAVGWTIFVGASLLWIGFDQPLHTSAVQLTAAYAGTFAIYSVLDWIIPIWFITWIVALFVLVGLTMKMLDIDMQDAFWLAALTWIAMVAIALFLL